MVKADKRLAKRLTIGDSAHVPPTGAEKLLLHMIDDEHKALNSRLIANTTFFSSSSKVWCEARKLAQLCTGERRSHVSLTGQKEFAAIITGGGQEQQHT